MFGERKEQRMDKMRERQALDHGYVRLVESWGGGDFGQTHPEEKEAGIIEAARQSTQGSFRGWKDRTVTVPSILPSGGFTAKTEKGDESLLRFLYENKPQHAGPFEFAGMVIEVKAPIFVFREWHRHRTQSYNEMSARYSPLPNENYIPTVERLMANAGRNKQAQGTGATLTEAGAREFQSLLRSRYDTLESDYQYALGMGVPKELARVLLPVGRYSKMRASTNLRNWLAFMTLRCDPAAQWEIRQYADQVTEIIHDVFPRTWTLWQKGCAS